MKSRAAQCASLIRKELKETFPTVKFCVISTSFGTSTVDVGWSNGPTVKQVSSLIRKYEMGSYNGMEDIYEYTNLNEHLPQVKYIFCNR